MTPRQVSQLMIDRANKKFDTKGERQFDEYQQSRVMNLRHGHAGEGTTLKFYDQVSCKFFDFQLDFLTLRYPGMSYNIDALSSYTEDFEVDGKGHKTKWDPWKDDLKATAGLVVFHIPEAITKEEHWPYLDKQIQKCREGKCRCEDKKKGIHYIAG